MDKVTRDGKTAVLYSPGFGAGWSTWNGDEFRETLCMDARIVRAFLAGGGAAAADAAESILPAFYPGGAAELEIEWIETGRAFMVHECDGSERVYVYGDAETMTA